MKTKITKRYMIIFILSLIITVIVWLFLTYMVVFSEQTTDSIQPQYLINSFEKYVDVNSHIINDEGKKILLDNNLWAQIVNRSGKVLSSYNQPKQAQENYSIFEIAEYSLNSNSMKNQTVFISNFSNDENTGIVLGCGSDKVSKWSIKITGELKDNIIKSFIIFILSLVIITLFAGCLFTKYISSPVYQIIENINLLEKDNIIIKEKRNSLFKSVFDSIDKLKIRLNYAELERKKIEIKRNEWINNISHDMKTPLTTINGYAEIMMNENYKITNEERIYFASKIKKSTNTIQSLIEDLNFERLLNNGNIKLNKQKIDINSLLKECSDIAIKEYKNGKIKFKFKSEFMYVDIDKNLISRVFINIICNAFIHNNNSVDVVVKTFATNRAHIEISDNGKGMDENEMENVFKRYYRGKSSEKIKGSGLGLAISKEIIDAHGGNVFIKNNINKGITFFIEL